MTGPPRPLRDALDLRVDELLDELGAGERALASGAAAALVAAMAAEVVAGAARRSEGAWEHAAGAAAQAHALRLRAAPLALSDARAFAEASELLRAEPREQRPEWRDYTLGRALSRAAELPLLIAQIAADVAELAKDVAENGEPGARADAAGAALLAHAAARTAAHLVEVNLATSSEDLRVLSAQAIVDAAGASADATLALE